MSIFQLEAEVALAAINLNKVKVSIYAIRRFTYYCPPVLWDIHLPIHPGQ